MTTHDRNEKSVDIHRRGVMLILLVVEWGLVVTTVSFRCIDTRFSHGGGVGVGVGERHGVIDNTMTGCRSWVRTLL